MAKTSRKIECDKIIELYNNGESMNSIAKKLNTYTTTVKRILEKEGIKIRHDVKKTGMLYVKEGEKLIEWAKAQGRPVTKAELAKIAGTKRLSPSYFLKYPELGQYVQVRDQKDIQYYSRTLYAWLKQNGILYKPNDRKKLGISVSALLLEDYDNIAIQISIKPTCISKKKFESDILLKMRKAKENGVTILFLNEDHFENLDNIKDLLDSIKYTKGR